jgi:hypothetical protein
MSKLAASINQMRLASFGSTVAFFDFEIGVTTDDGQFVSVLKVRDNSLQESKNGDGYWVAYPSKARVRDGAPVMNPATGKPQYDDLVSAVLEQKDGKWLATDASYKFKNYIGGLATAKFNELRSEAGGRGAPRAAAPARTAAAAPSPAARGRAAAAPTIDAGNDDGFDLF